MTVDPGTLSNISKASRLEWLETNGIGGFSSSTVLGLNTRRYHGVLIAATNPPVERTVMLSRLDEVVFADNAKTELATRQFPDAIAPAGYKFITSFKRNPFPCFEYSIPCTDARSGFLTIRKTLACIHHQNTVVITYELVSGPAEVELELQPFIAARDYHHLAHARSSVNCDVNFSNGEFRSKPTPYLPELTINVPGSTFTLNPHWHYRFHYQQEQNRGQDCEEDLLCSGTFRVTLRKKQRLGVLVSTEATGNVDPLKLMTAEKRRRGKLVKRSAVNNDLCRALTVAADQFVVARNGSGRSIIAGYPWFTDWGRDTMIALPGITLVTGRHSDAREILKTYAHSIKHGLIPNRFPDESSKPEYNSVDATLWFFQAVYKYSEYTGDFKFICRELLPQLVAIIAHFQAGTDHSIKVDSDGLLSAGTPDDQLTWMDAKVDDWVVTPRHGKPVEVNALWHNALAISAVLSAKAGESRQAKRFNAQAEGAKESFIREFWNEEHDCLYDVICENHKDDSIRPNQIFSLSIAYPLFEKAKAKSILTTVERTLLTPVGLRSLDPGHHHYRGHYQGDRLTRDGAYHQGTVWGWLMGPYLTALIRFGGSGANKRALKILEDLSGHINDAGLGSVSEIFDGDPPHTPRGCIAQAWSVAEILRALVEDVYGIKPQTRL